MPETANPSSGSISTTQAADDVLIDASGRIGIGLLNPAAKVDISTSAITPGALRIKDGTEGAGKYLFSDNNGTGSWDSPAIERNWYAALYDGPMLGSSGTDLAVRDFTSYTGSLISSTSGGGSLSAAAGTITIPAAGKYRISVSIYWETTRTVPFKAVGVLRLNRGGNASDLWTFSSWAGAYSDANVLPTFITIRNLNAGDILSLATDERASNNPNNAQALLFLAELLL